MEIYAKIGTGPGTPIRVKSKRNLPQVDDFIYFKILPTLHACDWKRGVVKEIFDDKFQTIYMIDRI